jgi:hypothetical protein
MNKTNEIKDKQNLTESDLGLILSKRQGFLNQVWQAMRLRLCDDGMESEINLIPRPEFATYRLLRDPYDQSETLTGEWRDMAGQLQGEISVRESGQVYAEVNVIRNHPTDVRWFVEAVTAWGSKDNIKTELRLLPSV